MVDEVSITFILAHKRFIVNGAYGWSVYHKVHKRSVVSMFLPVENR